MGEDKKTVGDWLYDNIESNIYLRKVYNKLIVQYSSKLQMRKHYISEIEIKHLLRFADLLSKSTNAAKSYFHKNIAQNIVCILEKIYPENETYKVFIGSVLSNVNNYVGLSGKCANYENNDIIESMVEAIVKESHRLPEECGNNLFFDASQGIAFESIKKFEYYSFSGPTSMGKTFLVKMFIKSLVIQKYRYNYVILVPSKALINELKSEIITTMGKVLSEENYKVITSPTAVTNDNSVRYIMIYTQERLSYQLKIHENMKIDYAFIDEAQKISEVGLRSAYFYKVIDYMIKVNEETRIYFLCPYIPNPDIYFKLIPDNEKKKLKHDVFEFSPVNQHKSIIDIPKHEMNIYSDLSKEFIQIPFDASDTKAIDFIYRVGRGCSNIVFCDNKKDVENYAIEYWKRSKRDNSPELKVLIEEVKKDIHPKSFLVYFLEKGICCHVGYLPSTIKAKIERLFREKIIKTIFCTSTLLEGVNLPAENLFIVIKNKSYILKNSADFKNLMGRVGRKTYNLVGNVYVIPSSGSTQETYERCKELIEKPVENQRLSIDEILDDKLKKKIIDSLVNGTGTLEKGNMTYETFGMARFIINILIKCISKEDTNNYIYKLFKDMIDDNILDVIKKNFKETVINDDSNITADQMRNLDNEILSNKISYPTEVNYDSVKIFLENLFEIFQWGKYEKKTEIGKKEKLSYYAVLLNQWMIGHSVRRIIDKSIEHHRITGKFYDDKEKKLVEYTGKNSQDNKIVIECLTTIEDVLLFSISNYFTKFSERYKVLKEIDRIDNDWSEYLDFGTNDKLVIELQKVGFSREIAKLIEKEVYAYFNNNGILEFNKQIFSDNNEELLIELSDVKLNYSELFTEEF